MEPVSVLHHCIHCCKCTVRDGHLIRLQVDYYSSVDNWPLEADVTQFVRAISDAPLSEALLMRILKAGAEQSVPIDAADAIDLVENLSKRASISSPLNGTFFSNLHCYSFL